MRTRLALALLGVFLPISVLVVISHVEDLKDRRDSRVENFRTIDETIAAVVDGFARDLESFSLSTTITLGEALRGNVQFDQSTLGPYFKDLSDSYGVLRSIFLTDLNGRVVAGTSGNVGFDLSSREYVKQLQAGQDGVWSKAVAGSLTGQTTLAYGRVVRDPSGTPRNFLVIAFYPPQLAARLPADLPEDANVTLIDGNGIVLFSSRDQDPQAPVRDISDSSVYAAARDGESVLIRSETTPVDADERYGAFVPVERTGWVVGFTRPASAVDGPLESRLRRDMLIISGLLFGGFIAMLVIASRLSHPLSRLAAAAAAISRGEQPAFPVAAPDADVRQLEMAMDTMSRAVSEREERLRAQAHVLETLERVGDALATELDFDKAVASISQAALELTGAEAAAFFQKQSGPDRESRPRLSVAGEADSFPIKTDDPLLRRTIGGQLTNVPDIAALPGAQRQRLIGGGGSGPVRSLLGIPVVSRTGEVRGGLFLIHSQAGAFDEYRERLATGLARRASIVIENAMLYSEAREVQEELRRANLAKDEFIGVMSHELRTPITTIYGGARLLQTRRHNLPEEAAEEMIASIEAESERLYRLVENLLAIARADMGDEIGKEVVSVPAIIDQSVKQFANRHPGRPIEVHVAPGIPAALGEPAYLHQVLNNLISNADKYSGPGLPIDIEAGGEDAEVCIRVLDRGPGVPAEELPQIFESFYRSQRTAKQAGGKGLGLTVCKRLLEAMSGRIWASPREGGGLEVGFALPVATEAIPELEPAATEHSSGS